MLTHFLRPETDVWMVEMTEAEWDATTGLIGAVSMIAIADASLAERRKMVERAVAHHIVTPIIASSLPAQHTEQEWTPPPDASWR